MTAERHVFEELSEMLDGRLAPDEQQRVQAHLATCDRCRGELRALETVRAALRGSAGEEEVPSELAAKVRFALDHEDRGSARRRRFIVGLSAAAVLALLLSRPWSRVERGPLPTPLTTAILRDYEAVARGSLSLQLRTSDPSQMEKFFTGHGVTFQTRVFDLAMMRYQLIGGSVHAIERRTSALFVYRGDSGKEVVCQMFRGRSSELPRGAERRDHNGIQFYIYRIGASTLVFWQEGEVICVLASTIPSEEVVQLAFAKAVKV